MLTVQVFPFFLEIRGRREGRDEDDGGGAAVMEGWQFAFIFIFPSNLIK